MTRRLGLITLCVLFPGLPSCGVGQQRSSESSTTSEAASEGTEADDAGDAASTKAEAGSTGQADSNDGPGDDGGDDTSTDSGDAESGTQVDVDSGEADSGDDDAGSSESSDDGNYCDQYCDLFGDDCPPGESCTSMFCLEDPGGWFVNACIRPGTRQVNEPCDHNLRPLDPEQTCVEGMTCLQGRCLKHCTGPATAPSCEDDDEICLLSGGDSLIAVCIDKCDPLAPECPEDQVCLPNTPSDNGFFCVPYAGDPEGGEPGQACEECLNCCKAGSICTNPGLVDAPGCDETTCCAAWCDLRKSNPGCSSEQEICEPYFAEPIPGYEHIGLCALPAARADGFGRGSLPVQ